MPHKITLKSVTKPISVLYTNAAYSLPSEAQSAIDNYWEQLKISGKKFTRGDVFTIQELLDMPDKIEIKIALTDYAHYLATTAGLKEVQDYPCRVVHTSVLIKTCDNFLVFGEMADHTSTPKRLQCAGGGITRADIIKGNLIDIEGNAQAELLEETGLDWKNTDHKCSIRFAYIKTGGAHNFVGTMFLAETGLSSRDVQAIFDDHNTLLSQQGEKSEFSRLLFVGSSPENVEEFIQTKEGQFVDYLGAWLRKEAK